MKVKTIPPVVTFMAVSGISFILSVLIYALVNDIPISDIPDRWGELVSNWLDPKASFFLIFMIVVSVSILFVYLYNKLVLTLYKKASCKGKWNAKKGICEPAPSKR